MPENEKKQKTSDNTPPLSGAIIDELQNLLRDFDDLQSKVAAMQLELKDELDSALRGLAGVHLEAMLLSKESTLQYVSNPDAKLRQAAVRLAHAHWDLSDIKICRYDVIALNDPAMEVRAEAILALGGSYANTKDRHIGNLLATIVTDCRLPEDIRVEAYLSLVLLNGPLNFKSVIQSIGEIDEQIVAIYLKDRKA